MSEIDPEKILAELDAERLQLGMSAPHPRDAASLDEVRPGKFLLAGVVAIIGIGAVALWLLLLVLDQIPQKPTVHHLAHTSPVSR